MDQQFGQALPLVFSGIDLRAMLQGFVPPALTRTPSRFARAQASRSGSATVRNRLTGLFAPRFCREPVPASEAAQASARLQPPGEGSSIG